MQIPRAAIESFLEIHITPTKGWIKGKNSAGKATFLEDRNYTKFKCKSQGVSLQGAHWLLIQYTEVHSLFVNIICPE